MKILCLQLARFGDIYMSWPIFRAIKREHPHAVLHGLFRERFSEAATSSGTIDQVIRLPSEQVFRNLIIDNSISMALNSLDQFIQKMRHENYDLVINLSYSPLSSYLVTAIQTENTKIFGYQRHSDVII